MHAPIPILAQFKEHLRKYPRGFHLPNLPLSPMKGFYHNIGTQQAPPVYHLPYHKRHAELAVIKEELEHTHGETQEHSTQPFPLGLSLSSGL